MLFSYMREIPVSKVGKNCICSQLYGTGYVSPTVWLILRKAYQIAIMYFS